MSTNGVNTNEDTDMADCDGEVVTMMDVLQEQQDFEEDANAVLGASDDKNCTYSKGYIKRQAIYACMTCCSGAKEDDTKRAGVCLACSLSCHENHELIELYTKRNFCCDCGNPKFNSHPCQFNPNKNDINEDNKYNQNYSGLYCICHRSYPDPESKVEDEMIQCIICEDWLHASHLDAIVPPNDQYSEMICKDCMEKNLFLHDYSAFAVKVDNTDLDVVSTNDITNTSGTSDSILETSKENVEHHVSDVEIKDKNDDDNIKDATSDDKASISITESGGTTDIKEVEQTKMESNSGTAISTGNETKEENEIQSPIIVRITEEVNTTSIDSIEPKQEVSETIKSNSSKEEEAITENEISSANTMENESELKDIENLLDKNESEIEEEKLLYEEETSNHSTNIDDVDMKTIEKPEEKTVENMKDEASKPNTETPTTKELKEKINGSENSEPRNDQEETIISGIAKENVNSTETQIITSPESETVDPSTSNLDKTNIANVNEKENEAMEPNGITEENNITKEDPPAIDKFTEDNASKSKDELTKNVTEQNEMKEEKQTVDQAKQSEVAVSKLKDHSDNEIKVPNATIKNMNENKRKLSMDEVKNNLVTKKLKADEPCIKSCVRPKVETKHFKGATFWSSSFRQKLCTCNECLVMYKDLSVLFLIDPEDTVSAYEMLGKEKAEGSPSSQYEKGLQALSSLDRIQQINALTEYNKMRDKLLDFLKSFKDRREIVKEEDIKGFFAGMKPKREPDGVYFCR